MRAFFDAIRREFREDPELEELRRALRVLGATWRDVVAAVIFVVILLTFAAAFAAAVVVGDSTGSEWLR